MESGKTTATGTDRHLNTVTEDDLSETDIRTLRTSSEYYERRSKILGGLRKGDWWIAIGLYLIIAGVAVAVL